MKTKNISLPCKSICQMILLICLGFYSAHAQDKIVLMRGDTLLVKLIEISTDTIRFHQLSDPDSINYMVPLKKINKIIYSDGQVENVHQALVKPKVFQQKPWENIPFENLDTINLKKMTYKGIRLGYRDLDHLFKASNSSEAERYFKKMKVDKAIALSTGLPAIPVAMAGVIAWGAFSNEKTQQTLNFAILFSLAYSALEFCYVYYNIQAHRDLKKAVRHYNNVIAKHDLK